MRLVCLVSLQLLATHTAYLIPIMMICACYGTTNVSLFIRSLFIIIKRANAIPEVNVELY